MRMKGFEIGFESGLKHRILNSPVQQKQMRMSFPDTCPDDRRTATNFENAYAADGQKKRPDPHLQQSFAETDRARLRTATSISSTDTLRGAGARSPSNSPTGTVAGTSTTLPSASTTNSIRSPAFSFRSRLISPGMVVCPLLVIVEIATSLPLFQFLTSVPYVS